MSLYQKKQQHSITSLVHLPWNHANIHRMLRMKLHLITAKRKGIDTYLVTNTKQENFYRKIFGVKGFHCMHYVYVNENHYQILDVEKKYDAVYTAQMAKFKRMHLAKSIKNLFILTYKIQQNEGFDLHSFCPDLSHAYYNKAWCGVEEKNRVYNQSRVGLCLSKEEGPMLASLEYMLAGIPVVSTKSSGGRDQYYDSEYCIIVKDTAEAVKNGVKEMMSRSIDPLHIRAKTLMKLDKERDRYIDFVGDVFKKKGIGDWDPQNMKKFLFHNPEKNFLKIKNLHKIL
ncbi:MAG: glycosyltransferase family 4 protein [Leptolyngbya sp. SIO1D8]|nr:glycosyltransferase family 4 protein [Leptolyngbya sp. SIO1D8]